MDVEDDYEESDFSMQLKWLIFCTCYTGGGFVDKKFFMVHCSCYNNTQRLKTGSNVHPPTCEIHLTSIADQVLRKLTFFRNNNKVTLQEIKDNSLISDFHFPSFCFLFRRALQSTMREMHEEKSNSVNETSGLLRCFWKAHLTNYFDQDLGWLSIKSCFPLVHIPIRNLPMPNCWYINSMHPLT